MGYGSPDRVPYFEEGIREEVVDAWHRQGFAPDAHPALMFPYDGRKEIEVDLEPISTPRKWPTSTRHLKSLRRRLNPDDPKRLPENWSEKILHYKTHDQVLMLRVHRGFFISMGVNDWNRFKTVMELLMDDPGFILQYMTLYGQFAARLTERVLTDVKVDADIFSEPIGGNDRPLISPAMYEKFVLSSYEPVMAVLRRQGVETIIFRTFANARILIPSILKSGFNCLWACEVDIEAMDYQSLRREFGRDLRLIGGIDLDALRQNQADIQREIEEKVAPLVADGGYIPLADGRIREDVPYQNYLYYRRLLEKVTKSQK